METAATAATEDAAEWIYRMEVGHRLPLIDLDKTPIASLLSRAHHIEFLNVMRRWYHSFSVMYRVSGVFLLVILMVPREVGFWLTVPSFLLAVPALVCSVVMNSSDVLRILPRQYEFWFFTIMNSINWTCLASFYSDFRVLSLFGGIVGTQMVILIDSNFRTVVAGIRSTRVAAPVLLVLGTATFFRVIDTDDRNYRIIPVAKVKVFLVDIFVNTAITLSIFIARKGYAKRKVMISHSAKLQTIRCVVFRSKLQLKKPTGGPPELHHESTETRTYVMQPSMHGESPRVVQTISSFEPQSINRMESLINVVPFEIAQSVRPSVRSQNFDANTADGLCTSPNAHDRTEGGQCANPRDEITHSMENQQQVTLVSMQLSAIDVRKTVLPRVSSVQMPLSRLKWIFFHANAIVGFISTVITITRRPAGPEFPPTALEYSFALISLLSTLVFFITCVVSFHRGLIKSLLHNFDFLFSSVQFTMAIFLICDMVQWDFRTLGALAWLLWFHSVLTLDALTPPVKKNLGFRKIFLLPVIFTTLLGIIFILYGFFFSNVADFFVERTLWEMHFRGKSIGLRTKSLLMNRLFTVLLWSFRLIWEVAGCPDDELIFIRGNLDYYTPMEMFPPLKDSSAVASNHGGPSSKPIKKWARRPCSRSAVVHATAGEAQ